MLEIRMPVVGEEESESRRKKVICEPLLKCSSFLIVVLLQIDLVLIV